MIADPSWAMALTFLILGATIALFVFSRLRADLVALASLLALALTGILTTDQALAGFANSTTILVAALFVVGEGLSRTGVTAWLSQRLMGRADQDNRQLLVVVMLGTAALSAVLSNTGTVAMLMPAVVAAAWRIGSVPSRYLMPMAFAANLGGLLTLIGTPTNIVASDALRTAGHQPFGFFAFAWIGLPLLVLAVAVTLKLAPLLLPEREAAERPPDLLQSMSEIGSSHQLPGTLFWLRVRNGSTVVGQTLGQAALGRDYGVTVLSVEHGEAGAAPLRAAPRITERLELLQRSDETLPGPATVLRQQDLLLARGQPQDVNRLAVACNLGLQAAEATNQELASCCCRRKSASPRPF